jgi:hypothetical protein
MAGRRKRVNVSVKEDLAELEKKARRSLTRLTPSSFSTATSAPYGLTVQGDLVIDDSKIQEVSDDLVIDSPGKIKLDSHTGIFWFVRNETLTGYVQTTTDTNLVIHNEVANGDIKFSGNDGGVGTTALTLDMSEAGAATFSAGVTANGQVTVTTTTGALTLPRMTTTQRNALTAAVGMIIYNTTDSKFQGYAGSSWVNLH